jgi:chemotaxis protein MotB
MARKRKHPEHVNHERWLVSYADFITLLFAFFVVMFAASNSDEKKAGQVAQAVQVAFREMAIFSPSGKGVPLYDEGGAASDSKAAIGNDHSGFDGAKMVLGKNGQATSRQMREVEGKLQESLKEEIANHSVRLMQDGRGLTISLAEAGFFSPGSAVMPEKSLAVVDRIASILRPLDYALRVEGHTDNTPIRTSQFPSNWELSTSRATFLLRYLISNAQIPAARLSAAGYGEYRPVASNATQDGRSANRRVDLVVLGEGAEKIEPQIR